MHVKGSLLYYLKHKAVVLALLSAILTATFFVINKQIVASMNPIHYLFLLMLLEFIMLGFYIFFTQKIDFPMEIRRNKWNIILVGTFMPIATLSLLFALQIEKVSYAMAMRQLSSVFGILIGWRILKERNIIFRLAGSALIVIGIYMITVLA